MVRVTGAGTRCQNTQVFVVAGTPVAALATWFSASAVSPALRQDFDLGAGQAALLTSSVQLGFVVGAVTSAALSLADRWHLPRLYGVSALLSAGCTVAFPLLAHGATSAVGLRLMTGFFLAGVYPVGMKLVASWAPPQVRGQAFGLLVAALTMGSAFPQLLRGADRLPWSSVMYSAGTVAAVGAVVALTAVRVGPGYQSRRQRLELGFVVRMFRSPRARLANLGYFGHMWELYALWAWLPSYLAASQQARQGDTGATVSLISFASIGVAGGVGCLLGGWASDRVGRAWTAIGALTVSGFCCLLSPLMFGAGLAAMSVFLVVWGAAVIADSGVFSTALTESVDVRHVGTALATQTAIGFSLTVATIQLVPVLAAWSSWQFAFLILALGPALGTVAMVRFGRHTQPMPSLPTQHSGGAT
jgi:MFS family permease